MTQASSAREKSCLVDELEDLLNTTAAAPWYDPVSFIKLNGLTSVPKIGPVKKNMDSGASADSKIVAATVEGKQIATFEFKIDPRRPRQLYVEESYTFANYQRRGISDALFARAINDYPDVTEVRSILLGTNRRRVQDAIDAGQSCAEAMVSSPTSRTQKKFGFKKVLRAICDPDALDGLGNYTLILGR